MAIIEDEIRDESGNFPVSDLCTCETSQMEGAWSNSRDARLIRSTWEAPGQFNVKKDKIAGLHKKRNICTIF